MYGRVRVSPDWTMNEREVVADLIYEDLRFLREQILCCPRDSLEDLLNLKRLLSLKRAFVLDVRITPSFLELNRSEYSSYII